MTACTVCSNKTKDGFGQGVIIVGIEIFWYRNLPAALITFDNGGCAWYDRENIVAVR